MSKLNTNKKGFFLKVVTKKQASDTGMAIVLILLLLGYFTKNILFYKIAIPVLIVNMSVPIFFYFFAIIWLGFSKLLGIITSNLVLSAIYFIVVLPMSLIRKLMGKDTLRLKEFKRNTKSVMLVRNYLFGPKDIERPF